MALRNERPGQEPHAPLGKRNKERPLDYNKKTESGYDGGAGK